MRTPGGRSTDPVQGLTEQIADVQKAVSEVINTSQKFVFTEEIQSTT